MHPTNRTHPMKQSLIAGAVLVAATLSAGVWASQRPSVSWQEAEATAKVSRSRGGMVVTSSSVATAIGMRVLERGGTAVDAAVATAFALAVVDFGSFGLGGRTQMLIRTPDGRFFGIDGSIQVPAAYVRRPSDDGIGYTTIGVPGSVAALGRAHHLYGTKSLTELLAPAIELAEQGFILTKRQADALQSNAGVLKRFDGSRRQFFKSGGSPYEPGDRLALPDLARTMRAIAKDGPDAFYGGEIARQMAADIEVHGGSLRASDLAAYEAQLSTVMHGTYRGYELVGTHAPAAGSTVIEILHILERFDLSSKPPVEWAAIVAQALRLAFQDQYRDFGGPDQAARTMVSKEWAAKRAQAVQVPGAPSNSAREVYWGWPDPGHTTHFSIADRRGGLVASTQTLGSGMGAKVVTPGLGFLYAATMGFPGASASRPGQRATTSMSPFMVVKEGRPAFVVGAAGGMRIISAIAEVVSRAVDHRLPFPEAVAAPRVHPDPGSYIEPAGEEFALETGVANGWTEADLARIKRFGFKVIGQRSSFATIHGIHFDSATQEFVGVADPRGNGSAAGPK